MDSRRRFFKLVSTTKDNDDPMVRAWLDQVADKMIEVVPYLKWQQKIFEDYLKNKMNRENVNGQTKEDQEV